MKQLDFVIGFITGVAIGAGMGLLFAPQRGYDTRKKIAHTAVDIKGSASDLLNQGLNAIEAATGLFGGGNKEETIKRKIRDLKTELESFDTA